jgi:hypothetical protein
MDKATVKTLLLAAAILSPNLVARAAEPDSIKQIRQLTADQLRSTSRAMNGANYKASVEPKKLVTKPK